MKPQIENNKMKRMFRQSKIIKLALFMTSVLLIVMMSGSLYFRDRVYITDNGETKELMISEKNIDEILEIGGYSISEHDHVAYSTIDERNSTITITRAYDIIVYADGREIKVPVVGGTVAEALEKAGIVLGEYDLIDTPMDAEVNKDTKITITRVNYSLRASTSEIPFETVYIDNSNMVIGEERVVTEGENGVRTYVIKEKYVDGVLSGQEMTADNIEKEAVTMVIERGTALAEPYAKMDSPEELTLVNGLPDSFTRVVSGKATAYTAGYNARTASGRMAEIGTAAVNPNVIPYGSELYIVSQDGTQVYGYAIAADTGIALMDGTVAIDLYFGNKYDHYYDSCRWGAVQVDIYVLSEGNGY